MLYLVWSARAFSRVRQPVKGITQDLRAYNTPLWHNSLFQNRHGQTYYCPKLVRMNVRTVGAILEDDSLWNHLAPLWKPIYEAALANSRDVPPDDTTLQLLLN